MDKETTIKNIKRLIDHLYWTYKLEIGIDSYDKETGCLLYFKFKEEE